MKLSKCLIAIAFSFPLLSPLAAHAVKKGVTQEFVYCPTVGTIRVQGGPNINGVQLVLPDGRIERQVGYSDYLNGRGEKVSRAVYHLGDIMYINPKANSVAFQDSTGAWIHGCRFL